MPEPRFGRPVVRVAETASTMDLMADLADRGAAPGTVVIAGHQTAGRGRAGRTWHDEPWSSLLMSFLHVSARPLGSLGLLAPAVGLAVARTVDPWLAGPSTVKWPNDILTGGRKLAGVLITTRSLPGGGVRVIGGIGLNVRNAPGTLPPTATSLAIVSEHSIDLESVFDALTGELSGILARFENGDDAALAAEVTSRLAWAGQLVTIVDGDRTHAGVLDGIAPNGSLRLLDPTTGNAVHIAAGDLTRGPRPATSSQ